MKPFPKHKDIDPELLEPGDPMALFWNLAALATGLIVVVTWLALIGAMVAGWLRWQAWLFCVAPIGVWLALLGLPVLWHSQRGAVAVVAALATTAEAWLARAGYSIDLNRDGYIGWQQQEQPLTIEPAEIVRPLLVSNVSTQGLKLLPQDAPTPFEPAPAAPTPPPQRARLWTLPNGVTLPQTTVEHFTDAIFTRGWSRSTWVGAGKPLEREQYDGLINLLEQSGLLIGRKAGAAGRLSVHTPAAARAILLLPPTPASSEGRG